MKTGEKEAKVILIKLGYKFDDSYEDNNFLKSMPDLKFENGEFVEVTHTRHNHQMSKFWKLPLEEQQCKQKKYEECLEKIYREDISVEEKKLVTRKIKKHIGYDIATGKFNEFKCDIPISEYSVRNIIQEIAEDKGEKYKNTKGINLFIFVSEDEFRLVNEATKTMINELLCSFDKSPFKKMWLCEYKYTDKYTYDIENPDIITFIKQEKNTLCEISKVISIKKYNKSCLSEN